MNDGRDDTTRTDECGNDPPLYECVDPEHLGRVLFYLGHDEAVAASARFRYRDYLVTVRADGTILIAEQVAGAIGSDAT